MALVRGLSLACACGVLAGSLSCAVVARADGETDAPERALAAALFKEGRRLLDDGKLAEACSKFEESERLDPGGGTLLNLAECHRRQGRAASAWTEFTEALAQARRDGRTDRSDVAAGRIAELEPQLSRLSIVVPPAADRADLTVTLDHDPLRRPAWGVAVPLDPGAHTVQASAPGCIPWAVQVTIGASHDAQSIAVPPLELAPPELAPASAAPAPPPVDERAAVAPPPVRSSPWRDGAMIGAAVVGVVGVGLGSYFGVNAISENQRAASECPAGRCTNQAQSTSASATSSADALTVSFAIGAAGVAAAAALLFTRHAGAFRTVAIGATATGAWLGCQGEF